MELSKSRLRRNGLNTLKNALHPKHGLAWTDGKSVFLTPVMKNIEKGVDTDKHVKLGEFENVESLSWSHDLGSSCFLCVVHQKTVSLWWVEGTLPSITLKQTRKINATALPQGCLWNPYSDVLCILTKQQCSFYYQHLLTRSSYALPSVDSGKITCGTWSRDGQKLFIGLGSIVMVYSWKDIDKISDFSVTAWRVPDLDGQIVSMTSLSDSWIMCSAEMPLEVLCKQKADMFEVPVIPAHDETDIHNNNTPDSTDVVSPKQEDRTSMTDKLLNLERTEQSKIRDSSQLIIFTIENSVEHPSVVCSTNIQGILVPDILYFHRDSFHVVVGSNSQNKVHVYKVGEMFKEVIKIDEVELGQNEFIKGIESYYSKAGAFIMLMVGCATPSDPAFISTAVCKEYDLCIKIFPFPGSVGQQPRSGSVRSGSAENSASKKLTLPKFDVKAENSKGKHEKKSKHHRDRSGRKTDTQGLDKFLGLFGKSPKGPKIIDLSRNQVEDDELEVETVKFDDVSAKFAENITFSYENLTEDEFNMAVKTRPVDSSEDEASLHDHPVESEEAFTEARMDTAELAKHGALARLSANSRKSGGSLPLLPIATAEDLAGHEAVLRSTPSSVSSPRTPRIRLGINSLRSGSRSQSVPSMLDETIEIPAPDIISTGPELSPDVFFSKSPNERFAEDVPDGGMLMKMKHGYSHLGNHSNGNPGNHDLEDIEKQVKEQGALLAELHDKIESVLRCADDTSCVPMSGYQTLEEPELVKFNYMYHDGDDSRVETFLLDRRRVKLDIVLQAFSLDSLEITIGETAVLVGANVDGYIPVRFTPDSTVQISGHKKSGHKKRHHHPDTNC